ncbi:MAG: PAS domain S-box protein [Candidatus Cloacimonadota bacterium]|nr:MAG: PAS domain S-box protein [Candidatus Cloacimonadota bacterium]
MGLKSIVNSNIYRDVFEHLFDGLYFCDLERKIIFWNKGAEKITG